MKANRIWTWESSDGCIYNTIDYILTKKKWRGSASHCRAYLSADVGSDHQLLILNVRLKLKAERKSKPVQKFDIGKLVNKRVTEQYRQTCSKQFEPLLAALNKDKLKSVDEASNQIAGIFNNNSKDILGKMKRRTEKDWLSLDTLCLTDARRKLKPNRRASSTSNNHYNFLCREIKRQCKQDKEHYLRSICIQVESAYTQKKSREVYDAIRKITGKQASKVRVVKDLDRSGESKRQMT